MALSETAARIAADGLKRATDDRIRRPLWEFHPHLRLAVLHERAVRWGVPTADDFDPEYH